MIFGSVCSGIEAASVAWNPLGWEAAFFSEIEKFPSAVLAHHYPDVPNRGDMTKFKEWPDAKLDVLVGGTPCQSFSIAGLRKGLDDPRGNLMLTYLAIAARYRPTWLVWENVPGVLSSNGGKDFGTFLGGLGELGYGFAYRVLDAQYCGVPQRRRRVFVVGCLRDWRRAAAVLFERHSLSGNPAPSREAGEEVAGTFTARANSGGWGQDVDLAAGGYMRPVSSTEASRSSYSVGSGHVERKGCANTVGAICADSHPGGYSGQNAYTGRLIAHSLRGEGFDASKDGTGRGTPLVPVHPYTLAIRGRGDSHDLEYRQDGTANALLTPNGGRGGIGVGAIAYRTAGDGAVYEEGEQTAPLTTGTDPSANVVAMRESGQGLQQHAMQVRRLTPRECERLQGFPDNYTLIPGKATDGPRYRALGNSMAVPVMAWIGQRIDAVIRISTLQKKEVA